MNTKHIILGALVLTSSVVLAWCSAPSSDSSASNTAPTAQNDVVKLASTNYIPYSKSAVEKAEKEGKDVAVFFHGKNCGSCKKLDADIKANAAKIPSDMVIFNADWDANQELAKAYDVPKYHTVSYVDGDKVNNVKGLFSLADVLKNA